MRLFLLLLSFCLASPVWSQPDVQTFAPGAPLVAQKRLKFERYGMPAVAVGPFIYILGGNCRTGTTGSIERIDTRDNTVSPLKTVLTPRYFHSAEAVGPIITIFGGVELVGERYRFSRRVERFDTQSGKVTEMAAAPAVLRTPASVEVGGKIYVVGGSNQNNKRLATLWIYDPQTDKWTPGASLKTARECDVVARNGTIYAIGGFDGESAVKACEAYDIATDTWRDLPDFPVETSAHHLALVNDSIFAFGDYAEMNRVQKFDLKSQTWSRLDQTGFDARRHMAVCALDHRIYVIGGNIASSGSYFDEVQIFDADKLK
jgi:N-acetylneuraminic acid mutarotase